MTTGTDRTAAAPPRCRVGNALFWLALAAAYLYPQFLFDIHNPNERVRVYMTAAMVEHNTFAIGYREPNKKGRGFRDVGSVYDRWGYVNDKALVCDDPELKPPDCVGTLYSAKAPGTSFMGYPFYAALYGISKATTGEAPSMETILLVLRLFTVILPSLLMLVLFRRFAAQSGFDPVLSDLLTFGVGIGSMVYTYSHMFAGHQVAAYLLFFAFLAAWKTRDDGRWRWPLWAGLCAGTAVFVEYPFVLVVLPLFAYLLRNRFTWRTFLGFSAGGVLPAVLTGWFHWSAFGRPWRTAYATLENPQFVKDIAPGVMGLREPQLENLYGAFVSPFEGLFFFAPWMALMVVVIGTYFIVHFRSDSRPFRSVFNVNAGAVAMLTLFIACHSLWRGGWTLGPRYIVPIVPFGGILVLLGLDRLARRWPLAVRSVTAALVLLSILVTGACSLVSQGFHTAFFNPLTEAAWPMLAEGYVTVNLGHLVGLEGLWTLVPLAVLFLPGLAWVLWEASGPSTRRLPLRVLVVALVILGMAAGFRGLTLPQKEPTLRKLQALTWAKEHFYPYDSVRNGHMRKQEMVRSAIRLFPRQESVMALGMTQETLDGSCRDAVGKAGGYVRASKARTGHVTFAAALTMVQPLPSGVPLPLLLRPDFDIPEHVFRKLQDQAR